LLPFRSIYFTISGNVAGQASKNKPKSEKPKIFITIKSQNESNLKAQVVILFLDLDHPN